MAATIREDISSDKPVLFLAGDRRRDELPEGLTDLGIAFEELVVYRTIEDVAALASADLTAIAWVVFFSPSGVEVALELDSISWNSVARAAIGPTTAHALRTAGLPPHAVADTPSPDALACAVLSSHRTLDV